MPLLVPKLQRLAALPIGDQSVSSLVGTAPTKNGLWSDLVSTQKDDAS